MTAKAAEPAYTAEQAAQIKGVSRESILRAIRRTDGHGLRAKKWGRGYRISASALEEWFDGWADA